MSEQLPSESTIIPDELSGWLSLLEQLHPKEIEMGLERVSLVFKALKVDFADATVIMVAGTNGKGSTCRFLETLAQSLGMTTGVYSSPHITDYVERVRINDAVLTEQEHCQAFEKVYRACHNTPLTYFEFGTLAALELINKNKPDVIILEVGLGGRLDAVNVVEPDISVVTTIALDHQSWLGDTKELIAIEKAGIARKNKPCIIGELQPPLTLLQELQRLEATTFWTGKNFDFKATKQSWHFNFQGNNKKLSFSDLPYGDLLTQNIATAMAVACQLGWSLSQKLVSNVIQNTSLPGRYQQIADNPKVILDVAHNQQATEALAKRIVKEDFNNLIIVLGMLSDKDSVASLAEFSAIEAQWFIAPLDTPRSASNEVLNSALSFTVKVTPCQNIADAAEMAFKLAQEGDLILIFGSFHTISEFKQSSH